MLPRLSLYKVMTQNCVESASMIWIHGCHDVEFFVVLDYIIAAVGLLFFAFILNVSFKSVILLELFSENISGPNFNKFIANLRFQ